MHGLSGRTSASARIRRRLLGVCERYNITSLAGLVHFLWVNITGYRPFWWDREHSLCPPSNSRSAMTRRQFGRLAAGLGIWRTAAALPPPPKLTVLLVLEQFRPD